MDRRDFFKRGFSKLAQQAVSKLENNLQDRAQHWIRPPYAKTELDFLVDCTRCSACIEACDYNIIFPLAAKNGAQVMATPAVDLSSSGCHLCDTWPCVTACESGALSFATIYSVDIDFVTQNALFPKFATAVIDPDICLPYRGPECGACSVACVIDGALNWKNDRPSINPVICIGCAVCREMCISHPKAISISKLG